MPDDSDAWATLAIAVLFTGNVREALEHASMALSLKPEFGLGKRCQGRHSSLTPAILPKHATFCLQRCA